MSRKILAMMVTFCLVMTSVFFMGNPGAYALEKDNAPKVIEKELNPARTEISWEQTGEYGHVSVDRNVNHDREKKGTKDQLNSHSASVYDSYYNEYNDVVSKFPGTRDQNPYDTCWAFASTALAELDMVNDGDLNKNNVDLSELQLAYFHFHTTMDPFGYLNGDSVWADGNFLKVGGNMWYTMNTLAQGKAFTTESQVPYQWARDYSDNVTIGENYAFNNSVSMDQLRILSMSEPETIKQAIIDNGAVYISYGHNPSYFSYNNYPTYYNPYGEKTNHDVVIVGWNDNFPAYEFSGGYTPPGNGAWLVRNSWTTYTGKSMFSYFYMSYYESTLADEAYTMDYVSTKYDNIYQHDGGICHSVDYAEAAANVFTVADTGSPSQDLEAVRMTFSHDYDINYRIDIYTNLTSLSDPTSGTHQKDATTTGWTHEEGIYTVPLNKAVVLKPGDTYSIVVTALNGFEGENQNIAGFDVESNHERPKWFYSYVNIDEGESFLDLGYGWQDLYYYGYYGEGNLSIKGLTSDSSKLQTPKLTLSNVESTGKIKLTWTEVEGAEYYQVYRSKSSNGNYVIYNETDQTSYINSSTVAGGTYYYKVRAVGRDAYGATIYSDYGTGYRTCDLAQPKVTLKNDADTGKIIISWNKIEGADEYSVYRRTGSNGTWEAYCTTKDTGFTNSNTKAGETYYYSVKAVCKATSAANSAAGLAYRTCDLAKPNLKLTNNADTGKIVLSWDKVSGANEYVVYRKTGANGEWEYYCTTKSTGFTNTTAVAERTYYYSVKATMSKTSAATSAAAIKGITCDLAKPKLTLSNDEKTGKIKVSWAKVNGADEYRVYRKTGANGKWELYCTTTSTGFTNSNTQAGKTYYYSVKAMSSYNEAAHSANSTDYRTCDLAKPEITLSNVASTGKIKVSWTKVSGADQYEVYRKTGRDGSYVLYNTVTGTSFTNSNTTAGKVYYYKVRAIDKDNSAANSAYDYDYRTCDLARPTNLKISNSTKGQITLSWSKVEGADKYYIYRKVGKNGSYEYYTATTKNSWVNKSVRSGQTYYYKIRAIDANVDSACSVTSNIIYTTAK